VLRHKGVLDIVRHAHERVGRQERAEPQWLTDIPLPALRVVLRRGIG
jgi:hypothetical protein